MKINLKLADIEVCIDDPDEKERSKLLGDALGCIDAMIQSRVVLECSGASPGDTDESPGQQIPTDHKIHADIPMAGLYA